MTTRTIAIIGAGYSGTALALNLLRLTRDSTRVVLIERGDAFGLGLAYATTNPDHLLNVPAARMSAFATQPSHFQDWLRDQPAAPPGPFVPRMLYGAYIRALLDQGCRRAPGRLQLMRGDVVRVSGGSSPILHLADGRQIHADCAVLAVGNYPPRSVLPGDAAHSPHYRGNPWAADAVTGIDPAATVLVVGTGLTMVDTVVTMLDQGHRGPIVALSRHGLSPQRHVPHAVVKLPPLPAYPVAMVALLRCLRADAASCMAVGGAWQDALDRFRPHIQAAWMAATPFGRRQFLRHLRPWWDIHRHRIAGSVADRIDAARANGQLRILAGHIRGAVDAPDGLAVRYAPRGGGAPRTVTAVRVINCTGPATNYQHIVDPLLQALLAEGLACPDPLGLGLAVTADCALIGTNGATGALFAMGPVTRGRFWEVTSVPDIRQQCDDVAAHLAARIAGVPAAGRGAEDAAIAAGDCDRA